MINIKSTLMLLIGIPILIGSLSKSVRAEEESWHTMDDLVVSASPLSSSKLDTVLPVSVMDENSLKLRLEPSLGETLNKEPGVSSTYFGPGSSRPIIRGLDRDRIRVLDNGLGIGDVSATSEDHAVGFDAINVRKVEVVRGPATLRYGSTAIGGVVNMIDTRIPEDPIEAPAMGLLDLRYGTGDDLRSFGGVIEGGDGSLNYHLDGFYRETNDIEIPGFAESDASFARHEEEEGHEEEERIRGTVPNSDTETYGGAVGVSYTGEGGFIGFSVSGWSSEYGVPGHGHDEGHEEGGEEEAHAEDEEEGVRIDADTVRLQVRGEVLEPMRALRSITYGVTYSSYEHDEIEGSGEVGTTFENDTWESRVELLHNPIGTLEGAIGLQFKYDDFSAVGEEAFVPASDTVNFGLFLFEELPLSEDLLKVQTAVRYEAHEVDADGFSSERFSTFSGSAGLIFTPGDDYVAALNVAYTERAPQASELFADGPHIATRTFEVGDPKLDDETSVGIDLSLRKKTGLVTGGVSLFYNHFDRFISLTPTGGEEDGLPVFEYRDVKAEFYGGELELLFHLVDTESNHLHLDLLTDYVRGKDEDFDDDLPRITPVRYLVGLEYEEEAFGGRIEGLIVDDQDDVAAFETKTDGYEMLNVSAYIKLPVEGMEFFVNGTNLTDEEARVHTSFLKDQVPLRGRSVLFGLRTRI